MIFSYSYMLYLYWRLTSWNTVNINDYKVGLIGAKFVLFIEQFGFVFFSESSIAYYCYYYRYYTTTTTTTAAIIITLLLLRAVVEVVKFR